MVGTRFCRWGYYVVSRLVVVGIIVFLAHEAYFKELPPPPIVTQAPDPLASWQPPSADEKFTLNIRGNNRRAVIRMFALFGFVEQESTRLDILTESGKPTEARFYFTQNLLTGKTQVTEAHVINIRHIHRLTPPPLLAQSN